MKHLIFLCTLLCATSLYAATENSSKIEVQGIAQKYVTPDEMHWHLRVKTTGKAIDGVAKEHLESVNNALKCLQKNKINSKDTTTAQMQLQEKWEYHKDERVQDGYIATTIITFICRTLKNHLSLWQDLSALGYIEIDGINFAVSNINKIQEQLKIKALKNAQEKAEKMAAALEVKVGTPLLIQDYPVSSITPFDNSRGYSMDSVQGQMLLKESSGDAISAGQQLISSSVFVAFKLITE